MARVRLHALAVLVATLLAACKGAPVPNPLTGQSRYLCCNMFYEKPKITDVNYQRGTMIPFGTQVQILEVYRSAVKFQAQGHPPIELQLRYGKKELGMEQYLDRIFLAEDPHARLPKVPAATTRSGKGKGHASTATAKEREQVQQITEAITQARVEAGMTRDEVLMAVGYPPANKTPSLDSPTWTYWANRWQTFIVRFDGDKVSSVTR